ncbi:ABC transporter substrate-binding protein [Marinomonas piezotolerans]|uniref:ABC transporter substrate-binding protein n=1 Tax=Marinomonas piezotolerans TaxID=2213058 RepID=A0A370UA36_9GAMM|nr:transporter substrate-binding domain-containing protein [Marinomonas piezotolerans]RDL44640.1 ABC transporter substrate-binding protein [Marinomonas piezotolerans]
MSAIVQKINALILVWFMLGLSSFSAAAAPASASCNSLTATGNAEYPPFLWRADTGHALDGAVSHLLERLSDKIDIPIVTKYVGPWSRSQQEVRSGRVDLMAGAFYTSERADYMEYFSPAIMFTKSVVWQSKESRFDYHYREDLIGRWGVTVINNSFGQRFDDFAKTNLNLLTVASLKQAFEMLVNGRADYVLYELAPGEAYAERLGIADQVMAMTPSISSEGLFLAISKFSDCNSPEVKQRIADGLRELVNAGTAQDSLFYGLDGWKRSSQ